MKVNRLGGVAITVLIFVMGISYIQKRTRDAVEAANHRKVSEAAERNSTASTAIPSKTQKASVPEKKTSAVKTMLTIDAYDPDSQSIMPSINLWNNYETRGRVVGTVHHKDKVYLVERDGDGVLVETKDGTKGWLTYWFIKEYR